MSVGPLVTEISVTFLIVIYLLHKYGNWSHHHILVTINVFIAWFFAFIIISILPLDVSATIYRQCLTDFAIPSSESSPAVSLPSANVTISKNTSNQLQNTTVLFYDDSHEDDKCVPPWSIVPDGVLPSLWRVVYWTAQALSWIILPMMQSYSNSGDFTVAGKIRTAIVENVLYYGSYLFLFGFFFVYLAVKSGLFFFGPNLKVVCVTASNTWGLFLLVLLLGYGLVEVPRSCWNTTRKGYTLNYLYFRASKLSSEKCEAEEKVDDLLEELTHMSDTIPNGHPVRNNIDVIIGKFPDGVRNVSRNRRLNNDNRFSLETVSLKPLAKLHKQAIRSIHMYNRTHCQWNTLCEQAFYWEDVMKNENNRERIFKHSFLIQRPAFLRLIYTPKLEWYWNFVIRNWVYRPLSISLTVFSFMVVWSEMTFFTKDPTLSFFALFIQSAKTNYIFIEALSMCSIAYLCICAYYTVFRVRVLNYYYLAPNHQTNEYSLIFCGMMLTRLTPPLCLNFLGLAHLDSHVTKNSNIQETAYTRIMGHLDLIPFISDYFNIYFPIFIVFVCLATYFKLGSRLLHFVGFEQFVENDDMTIDLIEEGRELIKREKNKKLRLGDGDCRRRDPHRKFDISSSNRKNNRGSSSSLVEESVDSELLRNVVPVDYTEEKRPNPKLDIESTENSFEENYASEEPSYHSLSWNRIGRPSAGLFDDV